MIQRIVQFEKGSVNILMEKDDKSCEVELSSMSTQSSASPNSKSSNDGVSKESTRTVIPSHSRKRQKVTGSQDPKKLSEIERLKELLLKTDARLSEDGKSIKCLLCGKSPKLDKCKRSAEGHIKYFNRVHSCTKLWPHTNLFCECVVLRWFTIVAYIHCELETNTERN